MASNNIISRLQGQLPPHLARSDLAELAVLLRYAEDGAWAFAVYNTVPVRDEVAAVLRELLAPLPVHARTFSAKTANPLALVENIPPDKRAVIFFFDLNRTEGRLWKFLELQRENLAALPFSLVFWITPKERGKGVRNAPNFWSQRSGVFDFTTESQQVISEVRGSWAGQPVRVAGRDDGERQLRLFQGLLREYQAENAPPATLAGLHGQVAYLLDFDGQYNEAARHLEQQYKPARAAKNRAGQVDALNNMGHIVQLKKGRPAALKWYQKALTAAGDDPYGQAAGLKNMAIALYLEGDAKQAGVMLNRALKLYRAAGSRLGEANALQATGDVQGFKAENEAALASYGEALTLFRAAGSRLGEANTLQATGTFHIDQGKTETGVEKLDAALQLYRQIGDRVGQVNIYWRLGQHMAKNDHFKKAEPLITQAVELAQQILPPEHQVLKQWQNKLARIRAAQQAN